MQFRSKLDEKQCWSVVSTVADMRSDLRFSLGQPGLTVQLLRSRQFYMCSCPLTVLGNFSLAGSRLLSLSGTLVLAELPIAFKLLHCCQPFRQEQLSLRHLFSSAAGGAVVSTMQSLLQPMALAVQGLMLITQTVQTPLTTEWAPVETALSTSNKPSSLVVCCNFASPPCTGAFLFLCHFSLTLLQTCWAVGPGLEDSYCTTR